MPINRRSRNITEGVARAPNRSMYYALGYQEGDFDKPMIGVANGHSTITPCNSGLQKLADAAVEGIEAAGGNAADLRHADDQRRHGDGHRRHEVLAWSRARSSPTASRPASAASGWTACSSIGGCDKNMPGGMMGICAPTCRRSTSTAAPSCPGRYKGQDLNIVSVFEAVGQFTAGHDERGGLRRDRAARHPRQRLVRRHVHRQHDELGVRGARHERCRTRRRWPTSHDEIVAAAKNAARVLVEAVKKDLKPRDIVTRKSDRERGRRDHGDRRLDQRGAALPRHRACGRRRVDDRRLRAHAPEGAGAVRPEALGQVPRRRPAPRRRHPAGDEAAARRRPAARRLHDDHRQDDRRDARRRARRSRAPTRTSSARSTKPMYAHGHLAILKGNLSPEGAVAKITGLKNPVITGPARVFDDEQSAMAAIMARKIVAGDVMVLRYLGPKGAPGHAGDAGADERADRPGPRRIGRPRHRRALLGRHLGHGRRPRRARGLRRRHDRARARGRLASRSTRTACCCSSNVDRRRARARAAPPGSRRRRATRAACWPSSRRTRRARAAARCSTRTERAALAGRSASAAGFCALRRARVSMPRAARFSLRRSSFFFSMRAISRRLLSPDLSDQIHQSAARKKGSANFQRSPKSCQFQLPKTPTPARLRAIRTTPMRTNSMRFLPACGHCGGAFRVNRREPVPLS